MLDSGVVVIGPDRDVATRQSMEIGFVIAGRAAGGRHHDAESRQLVSLRLAFNEPYRRARMLRQRREAIERLAIEELRLAQLIVTRVPPHGADPLLASLRMLSPDAPIENA